MIERTDGHVIAKNNMLLRPGASRAISFRGTPEGKLSIRVRTQKGPPLFDTEEPIRPGSLVRPVGNFVTSLSSTSRPRPVRPDVPLPNPVIKNEFVEALTVGTGSTDNREEVGVIFKDINPAGGPILAFDSIHGLVMVDPDLGGGGLDPTDPPLIPQPPIRVRFKVQNGNTFLDETTQPNDNRMIHVGSEFRFTGHDIIDVVFTNPNDIPVLIFTFINVQNRLTFSETVIPKSLLNRVLGDTLAFLAPRFGIRKGKFFFGMERSVQKELNIDTIEIDIDLDVDASVNIETTEINLLTNEDVVRILVTELEAEIKLLTENRINFTTDETRKTKYEQELANFPNDFVSQTVDVFFSTNKTLPDLFKNDMNLSPINFLPPLINRPFLGGPKEPDRKGIIPEYLKGNRDDVAIHFHLILKDIIAGTSRLEVNVDTIKSDLYMLLRNGTQVIPRPDEYLPDDGINAGILIPKYHLAIDVSPIDVDLDLSVDSGIPVVDAIGSAFTSVPEYLAERGLETVANWLRDDLERLALDEGMSFLEEHKLAIGELAACIMSTIANRDHLFRNLSQDNRGWIIETLNLDQLAVPFVLPDLDDHRFDDIDVNAEPLVPIDGPQSRSASTNLGRVKHLVFLMMENRSFDHMLGYLSHPNHGGRTDVDGLNGRARELGGIFAGTMATPQSAPWLTFSPNPGHGAETVARQINDGAMNRFASEFARRLESDGEVNFGGRLNDPERILKFHTADQLKTYDDLSKLHVVLDRWFCSIPGGTFPNRSCYYSGITPFMSNEEYFNDAGYLTELTLFDVLDHKGKDWKVYESSVSFLRMFKNYRLNETNIRQIEEFFNQDRRTELPSVTFLDPDFKGSPTAQPNDDHAPTDVTNGQDFIQRVVDKIKDSVSWPETMLVVIYDEHGGFADHVPPPGTAASDFPPAADGSPTVPLAHPEAGSYGVRIPSFVVSPLSTGSVGHKIYDHATVYRTILELFMPELVDSVIIPERVRQARHLGEIISRLDLAEIAVPNEGLVIADGQQPTPDAGPLGAIIPAATADVALGPVQPVPPSPIRVGPDAVIRNDSDDVRPHFVSSDGKDFKDFHEFLTRLGNPIKKT